MAAYAQFGYNYPAENELLTATTDSQSAHDGSPLSNTNEASLSPSAGSTTTGITTGLLSPGANSQSGQGQQKSATAKLADDTSGNNNKLTTSKSGGGAVKVLESEVHVNVPESTSCCENGRRIITDPVTGHTVCSCQYESTHLTIGGYSRMALPSAGIGVYGGPYPSNEQNPYPSIGVDNSAFYAPLSNPYGIKDSNASTDMNAWASAGLQSTTSFYSYDPTLAAYGYGPNYDLAARRKNATRESTATLKAWLSEHKKNPYPTKGEKIMLAIITKMTLTQVSTWFANARRRLKKENKMTWEPKNKTEDDDDNLISDDEKDKDVCDGPKLPADTFDPNNQHIKAELAKVEKEVTDDQRVERESANTNIMPMRGIASYGSAHFNPPSIHSTYSSYARAQQEQQPSDHQHSMPAPYFYSGYGQEDASDYAVQKNPLSRDCGIPVPANKPKIWSVADTVACKTPPPTVYLGQNFYPPAQVSTSEPETAQLQHQHQHHMVSPQSQTPAILSNNTMIGPQMNLSSPLNMMNSYAAASPYSRIPTVYTEAMGMHIGPGSGPAVVSVTNKTPTTINIHRESYPFPPIPTRIGFSEIQPDTPPQTPPNMKLNNQHNNANSNNNNSSSCSGQSGGTPGTAPVVSMTNIVYSNGGSNVYTNSSGYLAGSRSDS